MPSFVRGSTISIGATVLTHLGAPMTPSSATAYLTYTNLAGARTTTPVTMTIAANVVSATWDSSVAKDGAVRYSIKAVGSETIVQDGDFVLTANEANPTS